MMTRSARTSATSTEVSPPGASLHELLVRQHRTDADADLSASAPFLGFCVDTHHPEGRGRALIRWTARERAEERWLPCLQSLALREGDRVMVTALSNFDEPIVIGVLDGCSSHPPAPAGSNRSIELRGDERLRVHGADGTPLVEVYAAAGGPVVQLLSSGLALRVSGQLALDADSIALRSHGGPVLIDASDDVEINGARVRLNSPDIPAGSSQNPSAPPLAATAEHSHEHHGKSSCSSST